MLLREFTNNQAKSLYVSRPLKNSDDIKSWAIEQGFASLSPELHVTIAYSKREFDWGDIEPKITKLTIEGGERHVEQFDGGAVVLQFSSEKLAERWAFFLEEGADWSYPDYKSHITITYEPGDLDISKVQPYGGPLVFSPETFKEVNTKWNDDLDETHLGGPPDDSSP